MKILEKKKTKTKERREDVKLGSVVTERLGTVMPVVICIWCPLKLFVCATLLQKMVPYVIKIISMILVYIKITK